MTGYRIEYSTVLWLLELQNKCARKIQTRVNNVTNKNRNSNCQCSLLKNEFIQILCLSRWLAVPIYPESAVLLYMIDRPIHIMNYSEIHCLHKNDIYIYIYTQ